jgi:hypothetical protein
MAKHSRPKDGVAALTYVPAYMLSLSQSKAWLPATSAGVTSETVASSGKGSAAIGACRMLLDIGSFDYAAPLDGEFGDEILKLRW